MSLREESPMASTTCKGIMVSASSWLWLDIDAAKEWAWLIWTVVPFTTTAFLFDPLFSSSMALPRMLKRSAFVFEAESSSLRVILSNVNLVMNRKLHLLSLCSLGPRLLFQWLSDVIPVKYDALLIVRLNHPYNSLDKGILEIDDILLSGSCRVGLVQHVGLLCVNLQAELLWLPLQH